jgi:hypothetical protein
MQKKTKNIDNPAFPPQLMQDNFGQVVALVPGFTKLEFTAVQLLPLAFKMWNDGDFKYTKIKVNNQYEAAVQMAIRLLDTLDQINQDEKNTLQIIE